MKICCIHHQTEIHSRWYLDSSAAENASNTDRDQLSTRATECLATKSKYTRNIVRVTVSDE